MAVHIDDLNMAHRKGQRLRLIEHIQLKLSQAEVELILQRHMLIIQRLGRIGINQTEHCSVETRHGLLVAVMTADKLNLIDAHICLNLGYCKHQSQ